MGRVADIQPPTSAGTTTPLHCRSVDCDHWDAGRASVMSFPSGGSSSAGTFIPSCGASGRTWAWRARKSGTTAATTTAPRSSVTSGSSPSRPLRLRRVAPVRKRQPGRSASRPKRHTAPKRPADAFSLERAADAGGRREPILPHGRGSFRRIGDGYRGGNGSEPGLFRSTPRVQDAGGRTQATTEVRP